jgi:membrane associated rhomboid family serine protease
VASSSADVCYRHPQRESWTLCSRCGRTICPECQILTPAGVRCPTCVQETGGSVTWQRAGGEPRRPAPKKRRGRAPRAAASDSERPRWMQVVGQMFAPGGETPVLSRVLVGVVGVLWIAGFFLASLPFAVLALLPGSAIQLWRFLTSSLAYPSVLDLRVILVVVLNALFFLLTAPAVEARLGRRRFLWVFAVSTVLGGAAMVLAGGVAYGLIGPLFAMFGAYLIFSWAYPPARVQGLILVGLNLLFVLAFAPTSLPMIVGGLIAGAGTVFLFQRYDDRPTAQARIPYLISGGVALGFVLLALLRSYVF